MKTNEIKGHRFTVFTNQDSRGRTIYDVRLVDLPLFARSYTVKEAVDQIELMLDDENTAND